MELNFVFFLAVLDHNRHTISLSITVKFTFFKQCYITLNVVVFIAVLHHNRHTISMNRCFDTICNHQPGITSYPQVNISI